MQAVLERLEANHIAWGIVTNKPGWLTEPLLEKLSLRQRAGVVVSGDTLLARKPDPAPLLHAATELGLSPAECIYIGDAERDVFGGPGRRDARVCGDVWLHPGPGATPRVAGYGWLDGRIRLRNSSTRSRRVPDYFCDAVLSLTGVFRVR